MSSTKLLNALTKISLPINNIVPRLSLVNQRPMICNVDQDVSKLLSDEIQSEKNRSRALSKLDGWNWKVKTEVSESRWSTPYTSPKLWTVSSLTTGQRR